MAAGPAQRRSSRRRAATHSVARGPLPTLTCCDASDVAIDAAAPSGKRGDVFQIGLQVRMGLRISQVCLKTELAGYS
jgi:hypothetical protein